jgi:cation-transporting ATPase F
MPAAEVAAHWQVDPRVGLDEQQAAERLRRHGPNRPRSQSGPGPLARLAAQFVQPLVLVLLAAAGITAVLGEWVDSGVIFGVVLINAVVGFVQEGKAQAALAALARALAAEAIVLRGGARRKLDAAELVPGDVVVLAAGDRIPADLRFVAGKELRAAEAALTGESVPVDKHHAQVPVDTLLADRRNMGYGGTFVVGGQATGVVVATGEATETGSISRLIATAADLATPLTRRMDRFGVRLLVAILLLAALTFAVGVLRGQEAFQMFMAAVALAVSAIPEGLPAAMTVTLAIGVNHMARRRAIVRRLPAVETLGSTTVICSDKTGTLTENAMTVRELWAGGALFTLGGHGYNPAGTISLGSAPATISGALREALVAGALCNDARLARHGHQWEITGDPTEAALLVAARKGGLDEATLAALLPRVDELPFDSVRQSMATLHELEGRRILYAKGAVEKLLPACGAALGPDGHEAPLDAAAVEAQAARMAQAGLRVLALARGELPAAAALEAVHAQQGLVFLGLAGMIDPPRARSISAVAACHRAGIRVKMITGDHPGTAEAIARQLGIGGARPRAVTGRELSLMDDTELQRVASEVEVFARVEPEQKLRLVRALQARGEVVAMTGDGVNDAPALKQADIGIAMGLGGTEVAKETADIVLTDDNFATIEAAVEEGRGIYDNLVKFIAWTLPTNAGEGLVVLLAVLAGWVLPMTPLQILWNNMTTAALLGMSLAFEPTERGVMLRPPRAPGAPVLDRALVERTLLVSAFMLAGAFGLFQLALWRGDSLEQARTLACNLFVVVETLYLFNCRSLERPFWAIGAFGNPWVWVGALAMLCAQAAFTYLPAFNRVFQTAPLDAVDWLGVVAVAGACTVAVELHKGAWHARAMARAA